MSRREIRRDRTLSLALVALVGLLAASAAGCVGTLQPAPERDDSGQPAALARIAGVNEVLVMIAAAEGRAALELGDARGRIVTFQRIGDMVMANDGRVGDELDLWPRAAGAGLTFEGRTYPGHLVVRAHPRDGLRLFNVVDLELYVEAVVAAELPLWSARPAELAAQAVAVRTYTLYTLAVRRAERGDSSVIFLWDSVEDLDTRHGPDTRRPPRRLALPRFLWRPHRQSGGRVPRARTRRDLGHLRALCPAGGQRGVQWGTR
jgi:hypothetical protein